MTVYIDGKRFVEMLGADEEVIVDFRTDFRDFLYDYDAVFDIYFIFSFLQRIMLDRMIRCRKSLKLNQCKYTYKMTDNNNTNNNKILPRNTEFNAYSMISNWEVQ